MTRIKRGYYRPPRSGRICVPGYEWTAAILTSRVDKPQICQMNWWTTRGRHRDERSNIFYKMLKEVALLQQQTKASIWHILDRGYANASILDWMFSFRQSFIIRWKSNQLLINEKGQKKNTYRHSLGQKAVSSRLLWDKERQEHRRVSILYRQVKHPEFEGKQLYLVIVRDKRKGSSPMYLLTDVQVDTAGMAWEILYSYMKRWDVEQSFRFGKTAMAMESPRLWFWENRIKLLMIVAFVMSFLLQLLSKSKNYALELIRTWCPRTGKWQSKVALPLYRLRLAISQLILYEIIPIAVLLATQKNKG